MEPVDRILVPSFDSGCAAGNASQAPNLPLRKAWICTYLTGDLFSSVSEQERLTEELSIALASSTRLWLYEEVTVQLCIPPATSEPERIQGKKLILLLLLL